MAFVAGIESPPVLDYPDTPFSVFCRKQLVAAGTACKT